MMMVGEGDVSGVSGGEAVSHGISPAVASVNVFFSSLTAIERSEPLFPSDSAPFRSFLGAGHHHWIPVTIYTFSSILPRCSNQRLSTILNTAGTDGCSSSRS
jgi:hypothetical protein